LPQSSQDQSWSIRPIVLAAPASKRELSATSNTLPQRGHCGLLRPSLAKNRGARTWHADWTIIADPPRRTHPHRTLTPKHCTPSMAPWRRRREILMPFAAENAGNRQPLQCDEVSIGTQLVRPDMTQSSIFSLA
jgi:hypothetical protein